MRMENGKANYHPERKNTHMLGYFDIEWSRMGGVGRRHRGALPNLFHVRLAESKSIPASG